MNPGLISTSLARSHRLAAGAALLGMAFTAAQAQIPGDAPGGSPQYRDASGVVQPGSGAAGTTSNVTGMDAATPKMGGTRSNSSSPSSTSATSSSGTMGTSTSGTSGTAGSYGTSGTMDNSMSSPARDEDLTAPGTNASPANDGAWDVNGARANESYDQVGSSSSMALPSEPTAAGPMSSNANYGAYDANRMSWIPYTSSGYIGISGGKPDINTDCVAGQSCDDPDSAWSVYLGGQFNPYLGLQLGYLQLEDADRNGGETKARGVNIVLTGAWPLASHFSLNGRVGGTYGWTETSVGAGVAAPSGDEEGFGASYGVGASWDFDRNWSVTLDWDRHRLKYAGGDRRDTDVASVGLRYRF